MAAQFSYAEAAGPPTVNGIFYGDGDNTRYSLWATSVYGSHLYTYYHAPSKTLYVALVVDPEVNDNVFGASASGYPGNYMSSVGWGRGGGQQRSAVALTNSEFAGFTFACAINDPVRTWAWQQAYGCEPSPASNPWTSRADCGPGLGTPPPSYASSSSFVWNINNYRGKYGATAPPSGSPPWNMYTYGAAAGNWKSPFSSANPNIVPGDYSGFSTTYEWEWRMVYEWSVNLQTAGCGDNALYIVTGVSHHSPMKDSIAKDPRCVDEKDEPENDCFLQGGSQNPLSDWGDLPASYGTLGTNTGPRHYLTVNGPYLGEDIEHETDGKPTNLATGDGSEEDGVTVDLMNGTIRAYVSNLAPGGTALLGAWFDWNDDGDLTDTGEFVSWTVGPGSNPRNVTVPSGFLQNRPQLYARFRLFSSAAAAPGGSLGQGDYLGVATDGEVEDHRFTRSASIGNRIWVDENSDGYQDAGEPGIPNVQVNLYDAAGNVVATTYTDSDGRYLFADLWPGSYYVDVLDGTDSQTNTLPFPNMTQTPPSTLEKADLGNQAHTTAIPSTSYSGYSVTVSQGEENRTADFGYNYRPATDVNNGTNTGAIGDRVWSDADGDGVQDAGEPGIADRTVTLYYDPDGNGVYDTVYATTTTGATGHYMFNNLPPGVYVAGVTPPAGNTQTGDPDYFSQALPSGQGDHRTTTPIILAPGDVFLNADFGYQPPTSQNNSVGDWVWFDANANGGQNTSEPGIAGVTVALIRDSDGDGTWDSGEPIFATTVTGDNGAYLFTGVPDGRYLVWVSDADNVLDNKAPTFDSNGGTAYTGSGAPIGVASSSIRGLSAVALDPAGTNSSPVTNLAQDFGYTAPGQTTTTGLIGDRVWLDINGDGVHGANEPGLQGLRVELRDNNNVVMAVTYTDQNGYYAFGGLAAGTYTVVVSPPAGMTQTYDADGIAASSSHRSTVTIAAGGINLLQDFGYRGTGTIGNLVWEDLNADGNTDSGEPGIGGVTLDLYWDLNGNGVIDAGEPLVSSTTTASDGSYLFSGLPTDDGVGNAQFVVAVTDRDRALNGYWHSQGTAGADNNSQIDPYAVALTTVAPNNLTADFGYYVDPARLGNWVWNDANRNGIQDSGEAGIANVRVELTITYPNSAGTAILVTFTDSNGSYNFGNLLLDEDFNGVDEDESTYTITVNKPTGYDQPSRNNIGDDRAVDSNGSGTHAFPIQGTTNDTYDFGFEPVPTAVSLTGFSARAGSWTSNLALLACVVGLGLSQWENRRRRQR